MSHARPVWAEISRSSLLDNFRHLRSLAAPAELLAVVKANAYGHGAAACSRVLAEGGARWLGVTSVEEGIAVRAVCQEIEILAMGGLWPGEADLALAHRLTPVVWEPSHLDEAARPGAPLAVHLEIDTGMSRQGVQPAELPALLDKLAALPLLRLDGVLTHFHSPEMLNSPATDEQFARFAAALETIHARGLRPRWIHAGNSTSLLHPGPDALVKLAETFGARALLRPGLALYGYAPRYTGGESPGAKSTLVYPDTNLVIPTEATKGSVAEGPALLLGAHKHYFRSNASGDLKPVLAWKARVASLRAIEPGETAGYCATFRATRRTRLALLPAGYADGLSRMLSNRGAALLRGKRAPIAGLISMDLTILDVTDIPGVEIGDEALLIGSQGAETITAYDQADLAATIPYEILCNINLRVPRVMVD